MATKRAAKTVDEDIQKVLDKADEPTETFQEYHEWLEENTQESFDIRQVILSMRLYSKFQAHNRESGGTRTRQAKSPGTKPAATKPATKATRGTAKTEETPAAAKPKSGRRGKVQTDTEDAPF
jgi:hypothetical protein